MPNTDWVPTAGVGIIGSIGAWFLSWRINSARGEERLAGLQQAIREMRDDLKSNMTEVRTFADASARLQSSQNVVNQGTAHTLESIVDKQERIEAIVADHTATIRLLTEVVMGRKSGC